MAIVFLEGFDTYSNYLPSYTASIYAGGWALNQSSTNVAYTTVSLVDGINGGRAISILVEDKHRAQIYKSIPAMTEGCIGAFVKPKYENTANQGAVNGGIWLAANDGLTYVRIGKGSGYGGQFSMQISGGSIIYSGIPTSENQSYYLELEVIAQEASLYVNGHHAMTLPMPDPITFERVYLGGTELSDLSLKSGFIYDDVYVTDRNGPDHVGRLGPVSLIPLNPTSDGTVGNDFAASPDTAGKYDKIDDYADSGVIDQDGSYIYAVASDAVQTVKCSPSALFTGEALAFTIRGSYKSDKPADNQVVLLASKDGSEVASEAKMVPIGQYSVGISDVFTNMPDGSAMTASNLSDTDFGVRLTRII